MANVSEHGSTVLNKIIIPVLTTVLGATAIYFLGFNKKSSGRTDMEQLLLSKEATVKAWQSFVTSQNVSYKNAKSLSEEFEQKASKGGAATPDQYVNMLTSYRDDLFRESRKANQDIESLLKEPDLDRDFVSFLNRALTNSKSDEEKATVFFDKITQLLRSDIDPQQKGVQIQQESNDFTAMQEKINERSANEAEGIGKILAVRYSQAFDLNQLQSYADYVKEKGVKKPEDTRTPITSEAGKQAPADPNAETNRPPVNPPSDGATNNGGNNASNDGGNRNNGIEATRAALTGQWLATDGGSTLELSANGKMFWVFSSRGGAYTSGDWSLNNGKIEMHATNPDSGQTFYLVGTITNFTGNALTINFPNGAIQGVYSFSKKR